MNRYITVMIRKKTISEFSATFRNVLTHMIFFPLHISLRKHNFKDKIIKIFKRATTEFLTSIGSF